MINEYNQQIAQDLYFQSYRATFSHLTKSALWLFDMHQMRDAIQVARQYDLTDAEITNIRHTAWADAHRAYREASFIEE